MMAYRDRTPKVKALGARLSGSAKSLVRADRAAVVHLRRFFEIRAALADEMAGECARDLAKVDVDFEARAICESVKDAWQSAAHASRGGVAAIDGFLQAGGGSRVALEDFAADQFAALRATDRDLHELKLVLTEGWGRA